MAVDDKIKCIVSIEQKRYYKDDWGIVQVSLDKVTEGTPLVDKYNYFIVKGIMPEPVVGNQYHLTAKEVNDVKYGKQYETICMTSSVDLDTTDKVAQKKFLASLFTEKQVEEMYKALPDPFDSFNNGRLEDLVQIKGCGLFNAPKWMKKFNQTLPLSKMYVELEQFNLTNNMMNKLLDKYKSADLAITKIKENPYSLCEVDGIGWKRADQIALEGGIGQYSSSRLESFIIHYLDIQGENGYSYIEPSELMGAILETIGEEVSDLSVSEAIHSLSNELWWNKDKTKIGLLKYRNLENKIGVELIRLLRGENHFEYDGWKDIIKHKEQQQGWSYTEQQLLGIETVLKNQVTVIHGLAGTGKSTIVDGILSILKHYSFAQCALSGRASSRMAEITKQEGYTIHRLLGYPDFSEGARQGFMYHDAFRLPHEIIIIDEISMIDGYLFYYLLRALKTGSKVILLGDVGQLESIGCLNVAADLIASDFIPTVYLNQIHRQAQSSAIVTESIKLRNGIQLIEKDWSGTDIRGELQDLLIDCYSDKSNTFYKIMQHFSRELTLVKNIMDLQVIVPVKNSGDACTWILNNAIQELYNPFKSNETEIDVYYTNKQVGTLRLGDKVINTRNNYKTRAYNPKYEITYADIKEYDTNYLPTGNNVPIFNGNMGVITRINKAENYIIIDFNELGEVLIPKDHLKFIELGYAISVHKSQGSQFERIIVGIDYTSFCLLTKELLYTALTRAKQHCILVAQNSALRYATMQNGVSIKQTHLVEILDELVNPKLSF